MKIRLLFLLCCLTAVSQAQSWELGLGVNSANYQGDVVEPTSFTLKETNPSLSLFGRRHLKNDAFALRLGLSLARISGDDTNFDNPSWRQTRRFNFKSPLTEIAGMLEWQPFGYTKADGSTRKLVPYLFGGLGAALTNPKVDFNESGNNGTDPARIAQDKKDVKKSTLAIPLGAGFRAKVGPGHLGVEIGFRPTLSDYLDGISQAGNPDRRDWYVLGGLNYSFGFGKAKDSDGDGIADRKDKCPNIPGIAANNGCPADEDKDGVYDSEDICPSLPGDAINRGCPVMSMEDKMIITEAISNVNFKTGSAELEPASYEVLDQVARVLLKYPHYHVSIDGHTDNVGDDAFNLRLSRERAKSCFDHLLKDGVPADRMSANGYGETRPIASNDTEEGRRQNRRVEFNLSIK